MPRSGINAKAPSEGLTISRDRFDVVIFDCDGVLIDSEVLSCSVLHRQLIKQGMSIGLDEIFERYLGHAFSVVAEDFARVGGRPLPANFLPDMNADLFETFTRDLRRIPAIESVLDGLALPFCLISSSDWERIQVSLRVTDLGHYFGDRIYNSEMVAHGKPAPDLFLFAVRRMGFSPSRALVIEDSVTGVRAGKAAGMTVWGFVGGSHYAKRDGAAMLTEAGADRIFQDMADIEIRERRI